MRNVRRKVAKGTLAREWAAADEEFGRGRTEKALTSSIEPVAPVWRNEAAFFANSRKSFTWGVEFAASIGPSAKYINAALE